MYMIYWEEIYIDVKKMIYRNGLSVIICFNLYTFATFSYYFVEQVRLLTLLTITLIMHTLQVTLFNDVQIFRF